MDRASAAKYHVCICSPLFHTVFYQLQTPKTTKCSAHKWWQKKNCENLALRVESDVYTLFALAHTPHRANGCRFTWKRANHIAIKPKVEASKQAKPADNIHNSKYEVMVSRKMHKVNTIQRRRRRRRFKQNLENGFFADWTFYMCIWGCVCVSATASIQFIHHQKFKKLPFLLFLPLNFISIPHISLYTNQPDFLLSQQKCTGVFSRFYLLVVYRNHYLLFVRQTMASACSRGKSDNQWHCFTGSLPCDIFGCACLSVLMTGLPSEGVSVFCHAILYIVSLSYTNNKVYV